jgi:hypothetical protein
MNASLPPVTVSRAHPLIKRALAASFPTYKGRKITVAPYTTPRTFDLYWDGGTKDSLVLLRPDGASANVTVVGAPWANKPAFAPIDVPPGHILAVHSIFCGHDVGVTFYVAPDLAIAGGS